MSTYLDKRWFTALTDLRVRSPRLVEQLYEGRARRPALAPDGRLVIVAADHPARHVTAAAGDPWAMADRAVYLDRILRVLTSPEVDGVMATADILDDLMLLGHLLAEAGQPDPLAGKLLIGCLNRSGLAGAAWELDDGLTGHTPESIARLGLDGGKLLLRVSLQERDSGATLLFAAAAVERLAALGLPVFVEPLPVTRTDGGWKVVKTADAVVPLVGVASALGSVSAYTWLKLPMVPEMARVAAATTLPILLLGGESAGDPAPVLRAVEAACGSAPNVRGLMIGRNVLYPGAGYDPLAMATAAARVARGRWTEAEAAAYLAKEERT